MLRLKAFVPKHREKLRLQPIDFEFNVDDVVSVFGRNGAGKSTLFDSLCGVLEPASGRLILSERELVFADAEWRRQFGYLPQRLALPNWSTGRDLTELAVKALHLSFSASELEGHWKLWDLVDFLDKPLVHLSHGMQKRIGLCLATMHRPKVLILDEPFTGLDLPQIGVLVSVLEARAKDRLGPTLLSTHMVDVVARLTNRALHLQGQSLDEIGGWSALTAEQKLKKVYQIFGVDFKWDV